MTRTHGRPKQLSPTPQDYTYTTLKSGLQLMQFNNSTPKKSHG